MGAVAIKEFDLWQPGYDGATVTCVYAGTFTPQPLFYDLDATMPAPNPQTLLSLDDGGTGYGRFALPVYALEDYALKVSSGGGEAITRVPLTSLAGVDASQATAAAPDAGFARRIADRASYTIEVLDFGDITDSAEANTNLVNAAIGRAAALGGGIVKLPAAAFDIRALTPLPSNVRLRGHGIRATVMRAAVEDDIVTLTGRHAGLEELTLDGVIVPESSTGIRLGPRVRAAEDLPTFSEAIVSRVEVRRFERGIAASYGAQGSVVSGCVVSENSTGVELHAEDGAVQDVHFVETLFSLNAAAGCLLKAGRSHAVRAIHFLECRFADGRKLLDIEGAGSTLVNACSFRGGEEAGAAGLENLSVADSDNEDSGLVEGLLFDVCTFEAMRIRIAGRASNVRFDNTRFTGTVWELYAPDNNILLKDCLESGSDRIESAGAANLVRLDASLTDVVAHGVSIGTDPVTAWSYSLAPGEVVFLEASAVGRQTNGTAVAAYDLARGLYLEGATLAYDAGAVEFEVGALLVNKTRTGSARITAKTGTVAAGTLTLAELAGEFRNNDTVGSPLADGTVPAAALVNGELSYATQVTLLDKKSGAYSKETDSSWGGLDFVVNGQAVDVQVAGAGDHRVAWAVRLKLTHV